MNSEDLTTKFNEMVRRFRDEFNEMVASERGKVKAFCSLAFDNFTEVDETCKAEIKQNQATKAAEAKRRKRSDPIYSDDDIVHLNVGGRKFTTKRSTLCQVEGSLLASMFSGRWEDGVERDEDGFIFLDYNPDHFGRILNYLRVRKIASAENAAQLPNAVPDDQVSNFNILVEYLGLADEIVPSGPSKVVPFVPSGEVFVSHSEGVTLEENGKAAVHSRDRAEHDFVLGKTFYQKAIVRFKLKLQCFYYSRWMFVGVVKMNDSLMVQSNYSFEWPGTYGWALGFSGHVREEGRNTTDNTLQNLSKQGDTVELILDCDAAKLSLHLPTGQQFHIDIPKSQTWRLNVNFYHPNDKIRIIDE